MVSSFFFFSVFVLFFLFFFLWYSWQEFQRHGSCGEVLLITWVCRAVWPTCSMNQRCKVSCGCDARSCVYELSVATAIGQLLCSKEAGDRSPLHQEPESWLLDLCMEMSVCVSWRRSDSFWQHFQAFFVVSHVNCVWAAEQDQLWCKNGKIRMTLIFHHLSKGGGNDTPSYFVLLTWCHLVCIRNCEWYW